MANKRFRIIRRGKDCFVVPPSDIADHATPDNVIWKNLTKDEIVVMFPKGAFAPLANHVTQVVAPGGNVNLPIDAGATLQNYSYVVFCRETNSFAIGNSDPEIIVE
jgi:hypothetical protein